MRQTGGQAEATSDRPETSLKSQAKKTAVQRGPEMQAKKTAVQRAAVS